jgi:hypothetical protein
MWLCVVYYKFNSVFFCALKIEVRFFERQYQTSRCPITEDIIIHRSELFTENFKKWKSNSSFIVQGSITYLKERTKENHDQDNSRCETWITYTSGA